jgi:hypothetical protein
VADFLVRISAGLGHVFAALESADVLMVTRPDRLARSTSDLLNVLARLAGIMLNEQGNYELVGPSKRGNCARAGVVRCRRARVWGSGDSAFGVLMNARAFEPDLDCVSVIHVAYDPTRFKHDPSHGMCGVRQAALRYFHAVNED